jgi:hypothetical protein
MIHVESVCPPTTFSRNQPRVPADNTTMALGLHIRLRRKDDSVLAGTAREQRIIARAVLERGQAYGLLAFSAADTHLHMSTTCDNAAGEEYARRVEIAVTKRLRPKVGFAKARVDEVDKQWHLHNLCDYILRQDKRHGIENLDPLRECSNLPDLLGARLLGAYTLENLRRALPRFHEGDFLRLMGVACIKPADGPLELLRDAAAAAVCRIDLLGHSVEVSAALTAAVKVAGDRMSNAALGRLLGVSSRTVKRMEDRRVDKALVRAVRLQLHLRVEKLSVGVRTAGGELAAARV